MVIVHILPSLYIGGAERFVVDLCNELSEQPNCEVHLILLFKVEETMFLHSDLRHRVLLHTLDKKLGFDYKVFHKLYLKIKELKPNVVHTHVGAFEYNFLNLLLFKNVKFYHTLHSDAFHECRGVVGKFVKRISFYFNLCQAITISTASSLSFRNFYRLRNDVTITNGRSLPTQSYLYELLSEEFRTTYRMTKNTKIIVNVASIQAVKNQLNLVLAVNRLIESGRDIVLLIIGSSRDDSGMLLHELTKHQSTRIRIIGSKSNIIDYLMLSDIFCLSSSKEGMPISLIEAFSAKILCACTPAGGVKDMIEDNHNGFLSSGYGVNDLVSLIDRAVTVDSANKERLIANAYGCFNDKYSIEQTTKKYIHAYKSNQ
ncbi:MAG: glycosyltransferase family 4 protein [Weeksellaceae bacterium]|nr:glycosyltransferase family 4 protein [Bacteroidota bacterium]MCG2781602.1 glycosyltransferase family 4 protein [Weeksellaceae bacterium]